MMNKLKTYLKACKFAIYIVLQFTIAVIIAIFVCAAIFVAVLNVI